MSSSREESKSDLFRFDEDDRQQVEDRHENVERQTQGYSKRVVLNNPDENLDRGFASNKVVTSKYTWWNFLILFLYENLNPFNKFANFYFVCVAVLECVPFISLTEGRPQSLAALSFVLLLEAITSIRDDINRHRADDKVNSKPAEVLNRETGEFEEVPQCQIRVGDIVKVNQGDIFPADMIFLRSGDPKAYKSCWVNTKSLDGETDNKYRQAMKVTSELNGVPINGTAKELSTLKAVVNCELPNNMTNDFNGTLITPVSTGGEVKDVSESISIKNVLLRGCILKNTNYVYGAVISTGIDTKVEFKRSPRKWYQFGDNSKQTVLTQRLNRVITFMVLVLIVLCVFGAVSENLVSMVIVSQSWYIKLHRGFFINTWLSFFRYFLLCYQFIPVSLYVTMTLVYSMQSFFMQNDLQMYDEVNDEPMRVRSSTLNDDLGQVGYIFSDKTGTLTANLMQFRKCLIDGVTYGLGDCAIGRSVKTKQNGGIEVVTDKQEPKKGIFRYTNFEDGSESHPGHFLKEDIRKSDEHGEEIINFLVHMAINHTVIVEHKEDGTIELNASSPDEQAFVSGSYCLGVQFLGMDYETNIVKLNVLGDYVELRILHIIPYESSRKRMSVVVQLPDGMIILYCKGADSVMLELHDPTVNNSRFVENITCQVSDWAEEAFRTMVFGYKTLDQEKFSQWIEAYEKVCDDPKQKELRRLGKSNQIDRLEYELENGLILQGATAIEDSLQEGVPQALEELTNAGIHVWMITGDKVGTAKNIAVACNLLKLPDMKLVEFTKEAVDSNLLSKGGRVEDMTDKVTPSMIQEIEWKMLEAEKEGDIEKANTILGEFEAKHPGLLATRMHCEALAAQILNSDKETKERSMALVVDELFIDFLVLSCRQAFLVVSQSCKAVIACRARKDQKAKLTRLVRKGNKEVVTLAIGDGANDVEMIRAAHVGVGIIGKEGMQAVNNADYAIGQFRFLSRLLLVYGHRNYRGITMASLLIFYKNILFTLIQYMYTFICGLSGTRNQSFLAIMFYNTFFTAFGPLYYAVFDRDVNDVNCIRFPQLHREGIHHNLFNMRKFLLIGAKAIGESAFLTFFAFFACETIDFSSSGIEVYLFGMLTITSGILMANMTCALYQSTSSWISITGFWAVFIAWVLGVLLMSVLPTIFPYYYGDFFLLISNPNTYLITLLVVTFASLVTLGYIVIRNEFYPRLSILIQEFQIRKADPTVLIEWLDNWEKTRDRNVELKTIRELPEDTTMPELMWSPNDHHNAEYEVGEDEDEEMHRMMMNNEPSGVTPVGNAHRSIKSIAGLRALSICEKLHGPSYDPQSINSETQNELIRRINSHKWRFGKETGLMGVLKTTFKGSVNTINYLVSTSRSDGRRSPDNEDSL